MEKSFKKFFDGNSSLIIAMIFFTLTTIVHNSYSFYISEMKTIPYVIRIGMSVLTSLGLSMMIMIVTTKGNEGLGFVFSVIETFLNILYYGYTENGFSWPNNIVAYVLSSISPFCIFILAIFFKKQKPSVIDQIIEEAKINSQKEEKRIRRTNEEIKLGIPQDKVELYRQGLWKPEKL